MKEQQRWRSEKDSLLHACVKQYGARESHRMNRAIGRDPRSCVESWTNCLKPGIKPGSLSEDEQRLVISLQGKYGNGWKKIAAQVPGTTAKKLGKWWEVYREKQDKVKDTEERNIPDSPKHITEGGKYDDILETYAEKYMRRQKQLATPSSLPSLAAVPFGLPLPISLSMPTSPAPDFIHFAIPSAITPSLLPWVSNRPNSGHGFGTETVLNSSPRLSKSSPSSLSSPSMTLSLSASSSTPVMCANTSSVRSSWMLDTGRDSSWNNVSGNSEAVKEKSRGKSHVEWPFLNPSDTGSADQREIMQEMSMFLQHCRELEKRQQSWMVHKKETCWRLKRLEQQLTAEKARKRQEKMEEIDCKVRALREEEMLYFKRLEGDYREQLSRLHSDADMKEERMVEMWRTKHVQLIKMFETMVHHHDPHKYSDERP